MYYYNIRLQGYEIIRIVALHAPFYWISIINYHWYEIAVVVFYLIYTLILCHF